MIIKPAPNVLEVGEGGWLPRRSFSNLGETVWSKYIKSMLDAIKTNSSTRLAVAVHSVPVCRVGYVECDLIYTVWFPNYRVYSPSGSMTPFKLYALVIASFNRFIAPL